MFVAATRKQRYNAHGLGTFTSNKYMVLIVFN